MNLIFRQFGYAILGLGTRWVRDWYAIKALIISSVTRLHDIVLYLKGWQHFFQKKYIVAGVGKWCKSCNDVPDFKKSFCLGIFGGGKFLSVGSFWQPWGFLSA